MLTVAALAFSLTLSAITQASGQFTPRIFRNFMRDRANQFVLGYFVSVFAFCLIVLRTIRGGDELKFVPSIAVMVGLLLAVGGVLVLIFFIHHIADSLQITTILDNITDETKTAVEKLFPQELGEAATDDEKNEAWRADDVKNWIKIPALETGYVQNVDTDGLLEFAAENNLLIQMRRGIGQFAGKRRDARGNRARHRNGAAANVGSTKKKSRKSPIFSASAGIAPSSRMSVSASVKSWTSRLKALSPGINDTTTAVNCIDNLGEIVGELARRRMPAKVRSKNGAPRVIVAAPDFAITSKRHSTRFASAAKRTRRFSSGFWNARRMSPNAPPMNSAAP